MRTGDTPPRERARDGPPAAAHPGDDARVALHPADERGRARDARGRSRRSSSTRSTRSSATSADRTSRCRSSGSRRSRGAARPAHRPLGDAEAARGRRAVSSSAPAATARSSTPGTSASSTSRSRCRRRRSPRSARTRVWDEIYDAHRRARPRAPDDARLRQHAQDGRARSRRSCSNLLGEDARRRAITGASRRERRLDAEQRLKAGSFAALVATRRSSSASTSATSISSSRSARRARSRRSCSASAASGHGVGAGPEGAPLPADARRARRSGGARCAACARRRSTARRSRRAPLDILAQQIVAACVGGGVERGRALRTRPPRVAVPRPVARRLRRGRRAAHRAAAARCSTATASSGRLHGDASARASRRSRRAARSPTSPTTRCVLEPEGTLVGTRQRGLRDRVERAATSSSSATRRGGSCGSSRGIVRVADAQGRAADDPVLARRGAGAHARAVGGDRDAARAVRRGEPQAVGIARGAAALPAAAVADRRVRRGRAAAALGAVPTPRRVVLERFFDESGGMQLVLHAPFGGRDQPRLGARAAQALLPRLRLRAAGGRQRGGDRPLARPAAQLPARRRCSTTCSPTTAREVLIQALLGAPMFKTRWRWNVTRALLLERSRGGKRVPAPLLRMRADDLLAAAFPQVRRVPRDAARRATSRSRWIIRSCGRRSRTA